MTTDIIASHQLLMVPEAAFYHFGVLTSNVHMAWTRAVCGFIKSDYRYSKDIVDNSFPWPTPTDAQKAAIERTAQANDEAVMQVYGFWGTVKTEGDCVARRMEMYAEMTQYRRCIDELKNQTAHWRCFSSLC